MLKSQNSELKKVDSSDIQVMNMVQLEDLKKRNVLLELKLKQAENSKTSVHKLIQKSEENEELKNKMKLLEDKMLTQKEELKKLQNEMTYQISKEDFDKVEMKYTEQ